MPQVRWTAAQAVRQGGRGVQGQRFLPQRQPRLLEVEQHRERRQEQRQLVVIGVSVIGILGLVELVVVRVVGVVVIWVVFVRIVIEFEQFDTGRRVELASYPQARHHRLPSSAPNGLAFAGWGNH
jgi:hypothetical protein